MKKVFTVILLLSLLLLAGCSKDTPAAEQPTVPEPLTTTTVLVYMVGSDLEAKAGAATADLTEMEQSGVDLSRVNLVVYAGGSPAWHNETASSEVHTVLQLTTDGFVAVTQTPSCSMGSSECLTNFLNYGYSNFLADRYALVMWDHGNGPVIGYGKDMLFDNDSLTLLEMETALENSVFSQEKLSWVGFDACLMASAELACVWAPYADYMVASQEVEPSFGWNYSFLSQVHHDDVPALLQSVTEEYLTACEAYYESRGYDDRDTTLSCVDLSFAPLLSDAIDALFFKASPNMEQNYHQLAACRVNTRALGRASTGSEYDLIDLADMAKQLYSLYPAEAEAVLSALDAMVVANATNTGDCSGLSIYYPFYNKSYYEQSWGQVYAQLGLFPEYRNYLLSYAGIWLREDLLERASSEIPEQTSDDTYTLQLTPEQAEAFASAKYYILVRDGAEYYTRVFASGDITNDNGLLTANFDGNILYVTSNDNDYQIPVSIEHDTVGDLTRYSVAASFSNYTMAYAMEFMPENFEKRVEGYRFNLALNKTTGEVTVSSVLPREADGSSEGKAEEANLSEWVTCTFVHDDHRYLSRYENGALMPVDQWPADTVFTGYEMNLANGLEFVYAPLVAGEYYLLFEIEDTQDNRYCSELLPIHSDGTLPETVEAEIEERTWDSGEKVLLHSGDGLELYLTKTQFLSGEYYNLEVVNTNDFPVMVEGENLYCNDNVYCKESCFYFAVDANTTGADAVGTDLGAVSDVGTILEPDSIRFSLTVSNAENGTCFLNRQPFRIQLGEQARLRPDETSMQYYRCQEPAYDILAREQTLLSTPEVKVTLLGLGGNDLSSDMIGLLCMENLSAKPVVLSAEGIALDDIYVPLYGDRVTIPGSCKTYQLITAANYHLLRMGISSAKAASILLQQWDYSPLFSGNALSQLHWCPVACRQTGERAALPTGEQVLMDENGIRVTLLKEEYNSYKHTWYLAIENDTDVPISLDILDITADGVPIASGLYASYTEVGADMKTICEVNDYLSDDPPSEVSFTFRVMDFSGEAILFTALQPITLIRNEER